MLSPRLRTSCQKGSGATASSTHCTRRHSPTKGGNTGCRRSHCHAILLSLIAKHVLRPKLPVCHADDSKLYRPGQHGVYWVAMHDPTRLAGTICTSGEDSLVTRILMTGQVVGTTERVYLEFGSSPSGVIIAFVIVMAVLFFRILRPCK